MVKFVEVMLYVVISVSFYVDVVITVTKWSKVIHCVKRIREKEIKPNNVALNPYQSVTYQSMN